MVIDTELQERIRLERCSVTELREAARRKGAMSLLDDGIGKLLAGVTSLTKVLHNLRQSGVTSDDV